MCYALTPPTNPDIAVANCMPRPVPDTIRSVYDVILFGFEADVLEIRLVESFGLVTQTLLIESVYDHHGHRKPCVWKTILRHDARFRKFTNVVSTCIRTLPKGVRVGAAPVDWQYEAWQNQKANHFVGRRVPEDSIVVYGHADEIPSRAVWLKLATAPSLGPLPTNVAITNLRGRFGYAHRSPFEAHGHPYTIGSPLVTRKPLFKADHPHGAYKNVWLVGGFHLTNYCYAGSRVLKEWTATEARPDQMQQNKPSCLSQVTGCRRSAIDAAHRVPVHLPLLLNCSLDRYPEWWHRDDARLKTPCAKNRPQKRRVGGTQGRAHASTFS